MKNIVGLKMLICIICVIISVNLKAQVISNILDTEKEYKSLEEALKNPEKVIKLDLSNQNFKVVNDSIWVKFKNLEYLSLKNDHLKEIPLGIGNLKNLKILDLSGNDFLLLPKSFSKLNNLIEIYLNDEKKMNVNQSLMVIAGLPNLKKLHLEGDDLKNIPKNIKNFKSLEDLYINNNSFKKIPKEIQELKKLKYIDLHHNKYQLNNQSIYKHHPGIKIWL